MFEEYSKKQMLHQQSLFLIDATPEDYPLCKNADEALDYLNFCLSTTLDLKSNIDMIDYRKIIYIETFFNDDERIQKTVAELKQKITQLYIYKMKLMSRVCDKDLYNFDMNDRMGYKFYPFYFGPDYGKSLDERLLDGEATSDEIIPVRDSL